MCTFIVTTEALQLEGTLNEKEGELLQNQISDQTLDICITSHNNCICQYSNERVITMFEFTNIYNDLFLKC